MAEMNSGLFCLWLEMKKLDGIKQNRPLFVRGNCHINVQISLFKLYLNVWCISQNVVQKLC